MRARWAVQFLVIGLLGCRRERVEPAASVPDASAAPVAVVADAAVEPPGLRLVATTASYNADYVASSVDRDGTLYVVSGGIAYEARGRTLVPLLPITAYGLTVPPERAPFVGFVDTRDDPVAYVAKDARGEVRLFGQEHEWRIMPDAGAPSTIKVAIQQPVAFRGGLVMVAGDGLAWFGADMGEGEGAFRAGSAPREARSFSGIAVARDGTLVAPIVATPKVALWRPGAALDAGEVIALGTAPDVGNGYRHCKISPSFDGNVYVCCESSSFEAPEPTLHRLDGAAFVEAFPGVSVDCLPPPSIDRAGNLYRVRRDHQAGDRIERCSVDGTCTRIAVETTTARTARYSIGFDQVQNQHGDSWRNLFVMNDAVDEQTSFRALYARAPDDIWAIGDRAIFHAGGAGPTPPVVRLPTRADVRVELQNEHLPMSWNRDCDAVFVELAAGMAVDAGASVDREKMADVLGRSSSLEWQLVTGRLYDREVAGVVVSRGAYDLPRETMNAKIERLVETFTRDPMNVPQVHCTLPVLATVVGSRR